MKLSHNTELLAKEFGEQKAVDMLAEAGYDAIDFSFFDTKYCSDAFNKQFYTDLRAYTEGKGLVFNQAHAPFPSSYKDGKKDDERFAEIVKSIENASYLGIKNIVVHPCTHIDHESEGGAEKLFEINMEFYKKLIPYCEHYGVRAALENMWQKSSFEDVAIYPSACARADEFIRYFDSLNSECFTVCLDIGHTHLVRESADGIIRALGGKRLQCLHVHDVTADRDAHTMPFYGEINWDKVTKALADIDYAGDFTYECAYFYRDVPSEVWPEALRYTAAVGRYLIKKIEEYKKEK